MGIPFFDPAPSYLAVEERLVELLAAANAGGLRARCEDALREYTGAEHVCLVGSGTDALILLLLAVGSGPGDEVLVPAYSFFSTASSVALTGARPVFVDIASDGSYGMDPEQARLAITPRTKAILPAHLFNQPADVRGLQEVARAAGLVFVEDSAEGIGMRVDGVHAGLLGAGGVLSFFPSKTLGALGDAGAVITNDEDVALRVRSMSRRDTPGVSPVWYSACDELQAAVLLAKLGRLDAEIADRRTLAAMYDEGLADVRGLEIPRIAARTPESGRVDYVYQVAVDGRDQLVEHLRRCGVETDCYYPTPLNRQPAFRELTPSVHCPRSEEAALRALALPLYPGMPPDHALKVIRTIRHFFGSPPATGNQSADTPRRTVTAAARRPAGLAGLLRDTALSGSVILKGQTATLEVHLATRSSWDHCALSSDVEHAHALIDRARDAGVEGAFDIRDLGPDSPYRGVGDGVAIYTDSAELDRFVRSSRNHGQDGQTRYLHHHLGLNARFDEVCARHLLARTAV